MGALHETGHGLYEAGLPRQRRQPVLIARGAALRSQSLLMEMQACRSDALLSFAAPACGRPSATTGRPGRPDNIHRLYAWRCFIRVVPTR